MRLGRLRLALRLLFGHLFLARNGGLDADATKDQADAQYLHLGQAVAEGDDGQDHGEHLARDGNGDEQDRRKGGKRIDCGFRH